MGESVQGTVADATGRQGRSAAALLPILAVVFAIYLIIGIALPVLPLHVHRGLGLSTFMVGLVAGSQFAAALLTRAWAGGFVDRRGGKYAALIGLLFAALSGLLYLLSWRFADAPETSVTILLAGRALLGAAESFTITGALSWGMGLLGSQSAGRVMAWVGTALYAALAVGAPAGTALYDGGGFLTFALASALIPLGALPLVALTRPVAPSPEHARAGFASVAGAVWAPGLGLALSGVGFGAITTFIALLFAHQGWGPAWPAFTALSAAFVAARLALGHLPDRLGGARVALASVLIQAAGLALIWLAPSSELALAGATLTGLGYSLVFPGFGVEAVRRVPLPSRGLAMGVYTAFLDLSLGVSGPALGLVADQAGLGSVFLVSALVVLGAAAVAGWLLRVESSDRRQEAAASPPDSQGGPSR